MSDAGAGTEATREGFVSKMRELECDFKNAQQNVDHEKCRVFDEVKDVIELLKSAVPSDEPDTNSADLGKALERTKRTIEDAVSEWADSIERFELNKEFQEDFGDSLFVLVYGLVKSGKSSLGNFVAYGKSNPACSAIRERRDSTYTPDEYFVRALADGDDRKAEEDELKQKGKFAVDVKEVTSAIQGFRLGGLTWVDSPGLGSVTERNGELTKRYTDSADLVLVLMNMNQPGRRPELEAVDKLVAGGKPVLVLLTRADEMERDEVNGRLVDKRVMKPDRELRDAESYVLGELNKIRQEGEGGENLLNRKVVSVSVRYAEEFPSQDGLDRSGLSSLFGELTRIASEDGVKYKRSTPARNLINFIDHILNEAEPDGEAERSLGSPRNQLVSLRKYIDKEIDLLEERRVRAIKDAKRDIRSAVEKAVGEVKNAKRSDDDAVPDEDDHKKLVQAVEPKYKTIVQQHLYDISIETVTNVQAAVTRSIRLDVPRDTFVFEEDIRTWTRKAVARDGTLGALIGGIAGAVAGFLVAGPPGAAAGGAAGAGVGGPLGGALAGDKKYEMVLVDYHASMEKITDALGEKAREDVDRHVKALKSGLLVPIRRRAGAAVKRFGAFEEMLKGIKQSLEDGL